MEETLLLIETVNKTGSKMDRWGTPIMINWNLHWDVSLSLILTKKTEVNLCKATE